MALDHGMNEHARCADRLGLDRTHIDDLVDLRDGEVTGRRHHRVRAHRHTPVLDVAESVAPITLDEREIGSEWQLEQVFSSLDGELLFSLLGERTQASWSERPAQTSAPRSNLLDEASQRKVLDLEPVSYTHLTLSTKRIV